MVGEMYRTLYQREVVNLATGSAKFRCPKCKGVLFVIYPHKTNPATWHVECNNPRCDYSTTINSIDLFTFLPPRAKNVAKK